MFPKSTKAYHAQSGSNIVIVSLILFLQIFFLEVLISNLANLMIRPQMKPAKSQLGYIN